MTTPRGSWLVLALLGLVLLPMPAAGVHHETAPVDDAFHDEGWSPSPWDIAERQRAEEEEKKAARAFGLDDAREFTHFELYELGASTLGFPLTSVSGGEESVGFLYGRCENMAYSCAPPLQVVTYDSCRRDLHHDGIAAEERLWVRGVPAAFFERHGRLELATGRSTVVVYGDLGRERLLRAARLLTGVNVDVREDEPLPSPVPERNRCR